MHPDKNKDDPQANEKFAELGNGKRAGQFGFAHRRYCRRRRRRRYKCYPC